MALVVAVASSDLADTSVIAAHGERGNDNCCFRLGNLQLGLVLHAMMDDRADR